MLGNSINDNNFYPSSNVLLRFKENLDISMFDGQTNIKVMNR